jgi:phosphoribosylamine--glycine ligase
MDVRSEIIYMLKMANIFKKVLIIGSGGREHALVKACLKSPLVETVIAAPGNGGMKKEVECFDAKIEEPQEIVKLAIEQSVDFAIIGPEIPLCEGAVDALEAVGILTYGPNKSAARFEGSKIFTKEFLKKYKIPSAAFEKFSDSTSAIDYLRSLDHPPVIKASGLAAGKGVFIPESIQEAIEVVRSVMDEKIFGDSGSEIVIEEFMDGEETSFHIMVSGEYFAMLPTSRDHKRAGNGDTGLNTGGMGAYSPARDIPKSLFNRIVEEIVRPTIQGFIRDHINYRGTLYIGLMLTTEGPKVVEFNVRFGDPETQVLLPMLAQDPVDLMIKCAKGQKVPEIIPQKSGASAIVVLAASGYPNTYPKGDIISENKTPDGVEIIHAGTLMNKEGQVITNGGRVLGVTAYGENIDQAIKKAYQGVDAVDYASKYYRTDIGQVRGTF